MPTILGISRSPRFSPRSEERDAAIFCAVADNLQQSGADVLMLKEDQLVGNGELPHVDFVFSMARGEEALWRLDAAYGNRAINAPRTILQNNRAHVERLLRENDIPLPYSVELNLEEKEWKPCPPMADGAIWVKRADACAQTPTDVRFAETCQLVPDIIQDFRERGISHILLSAHMQGDLIKFYGVEGTSFFHYLYPTRPQLGGTASFSKFGLEQHNGVPHGYSFNPSMLKALADAAARVTGFVVYGGDAIITADGDIYIIDFNDWPSFASCREDAAEAIAKKILSTL